MFLVLMVIGGLAPFGIWLADSQCWDTAKKACTWVLAGTLIALPVMGLVGYFFPGYDITKSDAKHEFSREFSCPVERIDARPRDDINVWDSVNGPSVDEPSPEIKADPARYALWKRQEDEKNEPRKNRGPVFQMSGCGHEVLYECFHPQQTFGNKVATSSSVTCDAFEPRTQKPAEARPKRSPADGSDGSLRQSTVQAVLDANKSKLAECGKNFSGLEMLDVSIEPNGSATFDHEERCPSSVFSSIPFPTAREATHFMLSLKSNWGADFSVAAAYGM